VGVGPVVGGGDVEVVAARVAGRGGDGVDQRAGDAAAAGVLADDQRSEPRRRRVALEHVQDLQRREAEWLAVGGGDERLAVEPRQPALQVPGEAG
jgi:hypothetical protein